ncbi:MAG: hypothetical protein EXX96DRAFT_586265 [Benjaminiella poitrasii]|nr:MAG: hypothetical protein EXX96DRAFT_586265 [Benjaminiella poitrasii]
MLCTVVRGIFNSLLILVGVSRRIVLLLYHKLSHFIIFSVIVLDFNPFLFRLIFLAFT